MWYQATDPQSDLLSRVHATKNDLKAPQLSIRYWRISVTFGSGITGFNCMFERAGRFTLGSFAEIAKFQMRGLVLNQA